MKKIVVIVIFLVLAAGTSWSQKAKTHAHIVSLNFLQIKEEMNYGLVFRGPGIGYAYSASWLTLKRSIVYEGRFTLNFPVTRGIAAMSYNVVPVRLDYLFGVGDKRSFSVGPYFTAEYNYALYPDLQSGYSYWFTHFSLGAAGNYSFELKKGSLDLALHTTVLGLTSRQPSSHDPYFFDLGFNYAIKFVHQDMQFGSWNMYNQSELELRWHPNEESRLAYGYSCQYYGYFKEPGITMLNQTVKLIILPKTHK